MAKQKGRIGGFTAQNSGRISNCYSVVKVKTKDRQSGGFTGQNSGKIEQSYCYTSLNGLVGGFSGNNSGKSMSHCFFLHSEKEDGKALKKLVDQELGRRIPEMDDDETRESLSLDMENIWEYCGKDKSIPFGFIEEKWLFETQQPETAIHIKNADELIEWAKRVNNGDEEAQTAFIVLEDDINLSGKEWIPVGEEWGNGFKGTFDGVGHTIKGIVLNDKKRENQGFFGILKGKVYNLSLDCVIQNGLCIGALAAQNDGGTIGCCGAVVNIRGKAENIGGMVGKNAGEIFNSYVAGNIAVVMLPPFGCLFPILGLILLLLILFLVFRPGGPGLPTFAPVPYDDDAVPIPNEVVVPNTDGNFVSFQFEESIDVSLSTGDCTFNFKNPGNSNHNIVVQLQFTDAQAKRIMGSTGRTDAEQSSLEATPGYNADTYRTVIAESGAIRPGYQLENLKLVSQANGATVPAGSYNAIVYLIFYDVDTNNRAMLESQLPVVINVQ